MAMRLGPTVSLPDTYSVKSFGAVGDGVADDTAAIQATIDAAIQAGVHRIYLPQGTYRTTDTVHIGYGVGISMFYTFAVFGAGRAYNGENTGTLIHATAVDRPAIAIQGVRTTTVSDLTILGENRDWVLTENPWGGSLGGLLNANSLIEATGSNWIDPAISAAYPNCDSQHAPYVGIAIDPYSGTQPVDHYPDVTYPAWLGGGIPQYSKAYSSVLEFNRVEVIGFGTGLVCQPSGDGNGDFWGLHDCRISACKWGVSVGNTQAHNIHATKTMFFQNYCAITNYTHGTQNGHLDGLFSECYFGDSYQMFQLNTTYSGATVFEACYAELLTRLGDTYGNTPFSPITLRGCTWFLGNGGADQKFVPNNYVTSSGAPILFEGCWFWTSRGFFYNGPVEIRQCYKYPAYAAPDDWNSTLAQRRITNASLGEFPIVSVQNSDGHRGEHSMIGIDCYNDDTVSTATHRSVGSSTSDRYLYGWPIGSFAWSCSRGNCIPWATTLRRGSESMGSSIIFIETMPAFTFVSGISWTADFTAFFARGAPCNTWAVGIGDCVTCNVSGWRFMVTGIDGNTVNLEQLNGYYTAGGVLVSSIGGSIPVSGFISIFNSRIYTFSAFGLIGDLTSGSNTITNVQRSNGDGYAAFAISASPTYNQIHVGDYMLSQTGYATQSIESYPLYSAPAAGVQVTGTGASTITLSANAANTAAHVPINFWCKVD